jgi:Fe-S oxidoreductase
VRDVLYEAGIFSKYIATVIDAVERTGTNLGMKPLAVVKSIVFAAGEVKEEKKVEVEYYIYRDGTGELKKYVGDREVASWKLDQAPERPEALLVPPSADFFTNIETLKGYMLFLHLMGVKYAFSTEMAELANFGLFASERHLHFIGQNTGEVAAFKLGDTSAFKPHKAKPEQIKVLHERVGLTLPSDPLTHVKTRLKEVAKSNRNVKMALEVCVHCGVCLDNCPTYVATRDVFNSPVGRAELIRAVVKADSPSGKLFGRAAGAVKLNEEHLEKIYTYYYQCLECRKCAYACPFGIDQADLTRAVRDVLYEAGIFSKYIATVIDAVERTGTNLGMKPLAVVKSIVFAAGEVKEEKKVEVEYYIYRDDTGELKKYVGDKEVASW